MDVGLEFAGLNVEGELGVIFLRKRALDAGTEQTL